MEFLDLMMLISEELTPVIMGHYRKNTDVEIKTDGSPVTIADKESHELICTLLMKNSPYPILSEENFVDPTERLKWVTFWLIDPLDGTKNFMAGNDEFTVNIALMRGNRALAGHIIAPALKENYHAEKGRGAVRIMNGVMTKIHSKKLSTIVAAGSRFHETPQFEEFLKLNGITEVRKMGSALKFCRLATGDVNIYPRFVGSSEWDIAAGQIILEEAGCKIIDLKTGMSPVFNKPSLRNNHFIAFSNDLNFGSMILPKE